MIHGKIRTDRKSCVHPETGEILRRDIRAIEFSYGGEKLSWTCQAGVLRTATKGFLPAKI
ncbi:MAG: hypothetical protein J5809_00845 [Selenomonadaceae bacterium]|nr:hypothetical protein [Selenomonadaceae bacterium]